MPISRTISAARAIGRSARTPSASSTSALPARLVAARLPCFATGTPAPATTKAAAVETLKVPAPSPPVPQVSIARGSGAGAPSARARSARAAATISSTRLALRAQRDEQRRDRDGARLAVHDLAERRFEQGAGQPARAGSPDRARRGPSCARSAARHEVRDQRAAVRRQHRLGMELHAFDRQLRGAAHPSLRLRASAPTPASAAGIRVVVDHQRVVERGGESGSAGPRRQPAPSWSIATALPCRGARARTTRPPNATPIAW